MEIINSLLKHFGVTITSLNTTKRPTRWLNEAFYYDKMGALKIGNFDLCTFLSIDKNQAWRIRNTFNQHSHLCKDKNKRFDWARLLHDGFIRNKSGMIVCESNCKPIDWNIILKFKDLIQLKFPEVNYLSDKTDLKIIRWKKSNHLFINQPSNLTVN